MKIQGSVVLVTGANRGLGLEFAKQALALGAAKVYAGARDPSKVTLPGVIPVKLDVTRLDEVAAVAASAGLSRLSDLGTPPATVQRTPLPAQSMHSRA